MVCLVGDLYPISIQLLSTFGVSKVIPAIQQRPLFPIPGGIADPPSNKFLKEIRMMIRDSVEHASGRLEGLSDHNEGT